MSGDDRMIETMHGTLDRSALEQVRDSYDTTCLLRTVDELAEMLRDVLGEDGWRDRLLRLHAMAHTVVNDAGYTGATSETLPELATGITGQMGEAIERLQTWIRRIAPLEGLLADDADAE
jgi:hypothetical protein